MPGKIADPTVAHQVELVIHRLNSLSALPCIAARFLSHLSQARLSDLAETVESDPALAAAILSLMNKKGLNSPGEGFSVRRAIDKLPAHAVRQALLSVRVYPAFSRDERRVSFREQLVEHCLAVACCAEDIAAILSPQMDLQLAYSAGLLHDIGKLALDEAMPRSFAAIVEQAQSQQACSRTLEQKHLGLDHTILGKRLAAKWRLPNQIMLAIWLHHSDVNLISQSMPEAKIAQVVQLADLIARQCGIGLSGSFDTPDSVDKIAQLLAITPDQLEQIRSPLADKIAEKVEALGLDSPVTADEYCSALHAAADQLAQKQSELALENSFLQTALNHFEFTKEFLLSLDSNDSPVDVAENFAVRWQKFYQAGSVCLYLVPPDNPQYLKAVVVESPSRTKVVLLKAPTDASAIPQAISNSFAILNAADYTGWLFEQLNVEFDLGHTKLLPLLAGNKAVGAIVFELHYPVETEQFEEKFKTTASIAGAVLGLAFASASWQRFAEQFAQSLAGPPADIQTPSRLTAGNTDVLDALAEMAAGAAHELNNPLSVVSGRAQMLAAGETDPQKKQILEQIRKNAGQITAIIDDLFVFASPPAPHQTWTSHRQILDEAIQLASRKTGVERIDARIEVVGDIKNIFADSAQVASAIANVICNSIQSYADSYGPVKISASADPSGGFVKLTIVDFGCGMDEQTLQKAMFPFFSNLPAGRKRGMGLAHAARLIQLNGGSLSITSSPGSGTTVTILLPCKL
ncbi:MAG: HDOD domain-containing protein [Phycisphaerae bacterium]|nr:HDOD domain-containing protein [Phycisphaerae bacterium]MDD5380390.1 HDOD domain-containing protein [Phycisphaerae bacterium]